MSNIYEQIKNYFFSDGKENAYKIAFDLIKQDAKCINSVPVEMKTQQFYLDAAKVNGMVLKYIPDEFRTYEVYFAAVVDCPRLFKTVPDNFKTEELMIAMVRNGGPYKVSYGIHNFGNEAVLHIDPELLNEKIMIKAMKANGYMLEFVDRKDLLTRNICMTAVMNTFDAIGGVPDHIFDKQFIIDCVKQNWKIIKHIDEEKLDADIYVYALVRSPKAAKYVPEKYK